MGSIDQQFIEFIAKAIVSNPDAVSIERTVDERGVLLELSVDSEDLGRVIGKRGATAQSMRTLLRALGTKNDARYNLKIVDPEEGEGGARYESREDNSGSAAQQSTGFAEQSGVGEPTAASTSASDVVEKTRKELEDLDDLDV